MLGSVYMGDFLTVLQENVPDECVPKYSVQLKGYYLICVRSAA